ncbi:MAG: 1-acyl-sn-glycerol-3-phosphate acyltransferase [Bacteroidales bacterium]|nr:1-acyl-sn-glycerol-3-phosphate acyltransferase [Bacteroidales bacterium]
MSKIWGKDRLYDFLRPYVDWCTRLSFRSIEVEGKLPDDGRAVIVAPNHCNTLMDALVVLQCRRAPSVFGARADIFRSPVAARILRFLRILPIARKRDGVRAVAQNLEVIPEICEVLNHHVPFCMFPEGRHRPMYSLLPIRKGIVRIAALSAASGPTCIVPVGLDYSDFFHYRPRCRIHFGEPIDVNAYLDANPGARKSDLLLGLSGQLSSELSKLFLCIPDDELYQHRLDSLRPYVKSEWWVLPLAVLSFPFFLIAALLTLPMWSIAEYICRFRLSDKTFSNSIRYMLRLIGTPVMLTVWGVLGFMFLPWWAAVLLLLAFMLSYSFFYDWLNLFNRRRRFTRP